MLVDKASRGEGVCFGWCVCVCVSQSVCVCVCVCVYAFSAPGREDLRKLVRGGWVSLAFCYLTDLAAVPPAPSEPHYTKVIAQVFFPTVHGSSGIGPYRVSEFSGFQAQTQWSPETHQSERERPFLTSHSSQQEAMTFFLYLARMTCEIEFKPLSESHRSTLSFFSHTLNPQKMACTRGSTIVPTAYNAFKINAEHGSRLGRT